VRPGFYYALKNRIGVYKLKLKDIQNVNANDDSDQVLLIIFPRIALSNQVPHCESNCDHL
jgi:hypothetical protein